MSNPLVLVHHCQHSITFISRKIKSQPQLPKRANLQTNKFPYAWIQKNEWGPVRPCNFHTVVIGGLLLSQGPFQLKWRLWFLYRPKNGCFNYCNTPECWFCLSCWTYATQNHKSKTKEFQRKQEKTKKPKKTIPWRKSLGTTFFPRLWFLCFFCFLLSAL